MEVKKSPKASLENKRLLFTEIGLLVALCIVYLAFNYSSKDAKVAVLRGSQHPRPERPDRYRGR